MAHVRKLTEKGTSLFQEYLVRLDQGTKEAPPLDLLTAPEASLPIEGEASVERGKFTTRLEAAQYLHRTLAPVPPSGWDA